MINLVSFHEQSHWHIQQASHHQGIRAFYSERVFLHHFQMPQALLKPFELLYRHSILKDFDTHNTH